MRAAPPDAADVELLRARFERLGRVDCAEHSPLWGEVCLAVAGDAEILELVLCAPASQRRPTLLLAAIHDLLLAGTPHALAAHLPTVAGVAAATGRAGELAVAFCREHRHAVARILASRSTQTNESTSAHAATSRGCTSSSQARRPACRRRSCPAPATTLRTRRSSR